jgi:aspartyl-tRNA(Asn)/glutamyl-tRNA(Gln) amidotransferase subunit A
VLCGFSRDGLPIGLQLIGRPFDEARLLNLAHAYEHSTAWKDRHPAL